jgi:hypothetical protein
MASSVNQQNVFVIISLDLKATRVSRAAHPCGGFAAAKKFFRYLPLSCFVASRFVALLFPATPIRASFIGGFSRYF